MKFKEIVDVIDLEQDIKVLVDGNEIYYGTLEKMEVGQLLVMKQDIVEEMRGSELTIILNSES